MEEAAPAAAGAGQGAPAAAKAMQPPPPPQPGGLADSTSSLDTGGECLPYERRGPCERCKVSKVRCDKEVPRCGRCARLGVVCVPRKKTYGGKSAGGGGGKSAPRPQRARRPSKRLAAATPAVPPSPPRAPALEADVIVEFFIVALLQYSMGMRREPRQSQDRGGKGKAGGGRLVRDLPNGAVEEMVKANIALSNWASLRRRFGADFSRGALGAMEELLGPTPLPRLPPAAVVDIYPIACFRGLDACRDAPAELLTLDDGQSALCIIAERPSTISVHLNPAFEQLCMSYVDLCDLSARSTFHPLFAVARFVSETDVAEWSDAVAQAYLLGDGQTITSTIVKMYRNRPSPSTSSAASNSSSNNSGSAAPVPAPGGKAGGRHGGNSSGSRDGGVVLCLTRFRIVPVPATHTVFLAVQYTPLPSSSPHLLIPPASAVPPPRRTAAAAGGMHGGGLKPPPPTMQGKPLPRTNPAGITDVSAASFDALDGPTDLPEAGSPLEDLWADTPAPASSGAAAAAVRVDTPPGAGGGRQQGRKKGGGGGGGGGQRQWKGGGGGAGGRNAAAAAATAGSSSEGETPPTATAAVQMTRSMMQPPPRWMTSPQQQQHMVGAALPQPPQLPQQPTAWRPVGVGAGAAGGGGRRGPIHPSELPPPVPFYAPYVMGPPPPQQQPVYGPPPPLSPSMAGAPEPPQGQGQGIAPAPPSWMPPEQVAQFRQQQLAFQQQMLMQQQQRQQQQQQQQMMMMQYMQQQQQQQLQLQQGVQPPLPIHPMAQGQPGGQQGGQAPSPTPWVYGDAGADDGEGPGSAMW